MNAPPRFCARCGSPVVAGAPFCQSCGSHVEAPGGVPTGAVQPGIPMAVPVFRSPAPPNQEGEIDADESEGDASGTEGDSGANAGGCGRVISLLAGVGLLLFGLFLIGTTLGKGDDPLAMALGGGAALVGVIFIVGAWVAARRA